MSNDYKKLLELRGMDLWNNYVSTVDAKFLGEDFLDFAWKNKDKFEDSQLEYVCGLLGQSRIPHAERFLREYMDYPVTYVRVHAIHGLVNKEVLEPETLCRAIEVLEKSLPETMGVGLLFKLFTSERVSMLSSNNEKKLKRLKERFGRTE